MARAQGEREAERWQSWTFRLELSPEVRRREISLHGVARPLLALFFTSIPRGHEVAGLQVDNGVPQDVVTSFVARRTLCAVAEPLVSTSAVQVTVRWRPVRAGARPRATSSPRDADHVQALRLRRFGHAFLLEHRRLPTLTEVATALGLSLPQAEQLTTRTHAPLCEECVTRSSLPRMRIAGAPVVWRGSRMAPLPGARDAMDPGRAGRGVAELEDFDMAPTFGPRGGTLRVRPISASALRKLRRPVPPRSPQS